MIRMPQWMKDKWITALRSGEYKQGRHALKTTDGSYCCLGVLQHVVNGDVERYARDDCTLWDLPKKKPSEAWCLANGVLGGMSWVPKGQSRSLMSMNDTGEYTFDEIADVIEKGVEGY